MMQSQSPHILPSPARLGLSNAPSPSPSLPNNPNPNPNTKSSSQQQQQQSQSSGSNSTSNVLLSLLPPLPRAQSLLQQMASLSTALFEVSPNRSMWSSSYRGNLPNFLTTSSSSSTTTTTTTPPTTPSSTKELLSLFTSLQSQLFAAIAELQEILDLQDSAAAQSRQISSSDASLRAFAKKLKQTEDVLDRLVDDYSEEYSSTKNKLQSHLDLDSVLACAHRVSYTTFAPPDHAASGAPLRAALPPAPQDNEMRASQLYLFADLDVGVPKAKKAAAADGSGKDENMVAEEVLMEPTPPREAALPPWISQPMLPISVPEGWKKGMPVELPPELPAMPPGWKPGDPVPLPPMDTVREAMRLPAVPVPTQQEPFLVKHVQLDINPDEEEYSSDYSDDGSSDEDGED